MAPEIASVALRQFAHMMKTRTSVSGNRSCLLDRSVVEGAEAAECLTTEPRSAQRRGSGSRPAELTEFAERDSVASTIRR